MKKLNYLLPVIVFACILLGLCVKGITSEDKTYSSAEKRELQTRPKPSAKAIQKGIFQEKYETYLSDRNRVLKQSKREFFRKNMRHI